MKNKTYRFAAAVALLLALALVFMAPVGAAVYSDGSGTQKDPYLISTVDDLKNLSAAVGEGESYSKIFFLLTEDLDLENKEWTPIGNSDYKFSGNFDGGYHTISNLLVTGYNSYVGLFGFTTDGEVKNLIVKNAKVSGRSGVGAVAGSPYTSKYNNVTLIGHVEVNGMAYVGGLFGRNLYASVDNITINVDDTSYVNANSVEDGKTYRTYVGGVVGFMGEGKHKVSNVTSNIDVYGSTIDVGGITGIAHYGNTFENCICGGDVEITDAAELADVAEIGGIAGVWHNENDNTVTITNCEFTGNIKATYSNGDEEITLTSKYDFPNSGAIGKAYGTGTGKLMIDSEDKTSTGSSFPDMIFTVGDEFLVYNGITELPESGSYKLMEDIVLSTYITIEDGDDIIIEGNGKTITRSDGTGFYVTGGKLTLGEGLTVKASQCPVLIYGGEVITSANLESTGASFAISGNGDENGGKVTINGGIISSAGIAIYWPQNDLLTINGGTITGATGIYFCGGNLSISGGTIEATGDKAGHGFSESGDGCASTGDALTIENRGGAYGDLTSSTISITGGAFTSKNANAVGSYAMDENTVITQFITGGTFSSNPSAYIASGYEVVQPGDKYLVQKYVDRSSSSSSSSSTTEPEEPVDPEQPEEPVVEPETPVDEPEAGEATVETEVTDGGEVELETPTEEPAVDEGGAVVADDDAKITAVVLPTGTDSEVTFIPVSEQPAPAGQEENTKKVFEINVPTYEKGKAAVIKFTMTVAELEADGKTAGEVALWHFDEETGEWTKLVTSYTIVDGVVYFEAITNDFSPFAIIYEETPVDEPVEEPETPATPAPVLGVLAALGAAVVLRRK